MVLFLWNAAPALSVAGAGEMGGLAAGLAGTLGVFDFLEITQCFDHEKSSSWFNKGRPRDLQKWF